MPWFGKISGEGRRAETRRETGEYHGSRFKYALPIHWIGGIPDSVVGYTGLFQEPDGRDLYGFVWVLFDVWDSCH
jgi:hypothetical protein